MRRDVDEARIGPSGTDGAARGVVAEKEDAPGMLARDGACLLFGGRGVRGCDADDECRAFGSGGGGARGRGDERLPGEGVAHVPLISDQRVKRDSPEPGVRADHEPANSRGNLRQCYVEQCLAEPAEQERRGSSEGLLMAADEARTHSIAIPELTEAGRCFARLLEVTRRRRDLERTTRHDQGHDLAVPDEKLE